MSLEIVQAVKAKGIKLGVDLSGPCGAFWITKRVAWALSRSNPLIGLLSKPTGNNCDGYATDIIMYQNGDIRDILQDGGNSNIPQWPDSNDPVDPSRWMPAVDPGEDVIPPVPPPPPPSDLNFIRQQLAQMAERQTDLETAVLRLILGLQSTQQAITVLKDNIIALPDAVKKAAPSYTGRLLGISVVLRPS